METLPVTIATAKIKLWMLRTKLNDLLNHNMDRFVDSRGSGCGSVKQWRDDISKYLSDPALREAYGEEVVKCERMASGLGIEWNVRINSLTE